MDQNPSQPKISSLSQSDGSNKITAAQQPLRPKPAEAEPEQVFFNVMPKVNTEQGPLVESTMRIEEPQANVNATPVSSPAVKWKKYAIYGGIALVIAAAAGLIFYFVIKKVGTAEEENILTHNLTAEPLKKAGTSNTEATTTSITTITSQDWQKKYFNSETCTDSNICGDAADPDHDGLSNADEFALGTDPNNPDSDQDGLSDGDEVHVFNTNPLKTHSNNDTKYTDADYIRDGYDIQTGQLFTQQQITNITNKMKLESLHEPTVKTLKDVIINLYKFTDWKISTGQPATTTASSTLPSQASSSPDNLASSSPLSGFDSSTSAKTDRDTQRSLTIKNVGVALIDYFADNQAYPKTQSFATMFADIKPYLKVATNSEDPVNKDPYVYLYQLNPAGDDYTLSFRSEVANEIIKKHATDAQKDKNAEEASIYDDQRKINLDMLRVALLTYSGDNAAGNQDYVFPTVEKYKVNLVPKYIQQIPKDPKTGKDYEYEVSDTFDTFTLKAIFDNPTPGTTGYKCNQDECRTY